MVFPNLQIATRAIIAVAVNPITNIKYFIMLEQEVVHASVLSSLGAVCCIVQLLVVVQHYQQELRHHHHPPPPPPPPPAAAGGGISQFCSQMIRSLLGV